MSSTEGNKNPQQKDRSQGYRRPSGRGKGNGPRRQYQNRGQPNGHRHSHNPKPEVLAVRELLPTGLQVPYDEIERVLAAKNGDVKAAALAIKESRENSWSALVKKSLPNANAQPQASGRGQNRQGKRHQGDANAKASERPSQAASKPAPTVDPENLQRALDEKLTEMQQRTEELKNMKDQLERVYGANSEFEKLQTQRKALAERLAELKRETEAVTAEIAQIDAKCRELEQSKAKLLRDIEEKSKQLGVA